jgi:hypothetical protein
MEKMAPGQTFIRWKPVGLYNAMINPLINYKSKDLSGIRAKAIPENQKNMEICCQP